MYDSPLYPASQPYGPPLPPASWAVKPPPGTRYDHLGRTEQHVWWRPVLGTLAVGAGFLVAAVLVYLVAALVGPVLGQKLALDGTRFFLDPVADLTVLLASIAAVLPVVYGVTWLIGRRPPGTLSSVLGRLRWRWMGLCALVAVVALMLSQTATVLAFVATGLGADGLIGWVGWRAFLPGLLVTVLLVPLQAATEEYVFRGWLIQAFGEFIRNPWPGILIGAAGFTALHAYTGWGIADVYLFGATMGWLAVRTGGLEAAIALHAVNNAVAFGLSSAAGQLDDALRQGAAPWQGLVGTVVQLAFFGTAVMFLARRRGVETVSPG
jgi:membrane protease YdiL (CAAX protease family)